MEAVEAEWLVWAAIGEGAPVGQDREAVGRVAGAGATEAVLVGFAQEEF